MRFIVPPGIGDSTWALHKVQAIARAHGESVIDVYLASPDQGIVGRRAVDFVRRFDFVRLAESLPVTIMADGPPADRDGYYRYRPDGWGTACALEAYWLVPNTPLERGIRLEKWLPEYETNWHIGSEFLFKPSELEFAKSLHADLGPYAVFYLSSEINNSAQASHNRGPRWHAREWVTVGETLAHHMGIRIVVVGASYDRSYWTRQVAPLVGNRSLWHSLVGDSSVGQTFAAVRQARFVLAYQSGIGIFASAIGVPTGMFWRTRGDSISPDYFLSFEESMATAWVRPDMLSKYLPLIYGRHHAEEVIQLITNAGW